MKKRVLFMIKNMNVGGTEKSLLSLLSVLDSKRYDITILMLERYGDYLEQLPSWVNKEYMKNYDNIKPIVENPPIQTIKSFILKGKLIDALKLFFSYITSKLKSNCGYIYQQVLKEYPKTSYDIAIAYAGPYNFITYFIVKKIKAAKKIQWIHFDVLKIKINTNFGKMYYPNFDIINCVSENSKKEMQQLFPEIRDEIKVFHNIVNTKEINELAKKGKSFQDNFKGIRIVTLGRLSKEKGQQMIPEVVEKLIRDGYTFKWYIIGEGILRGQIETAIQNRKIQKYVEVLGIQMNPYPFIRDCDIYVQTSLHEGYGLTIHEAKVFNKPIVTTKFTGVNEQIIDGITGKTVAISEEGIYNGLKELLDNPKLCKLFSENLGNEKKTLKEKAIVL